MTSVTCIYHLTSKLVTPFESCLPLVGSSGSVTRTSLATPRTMTSKLSTLVTLVCGLPIRYPDPEPESEIGFHNRKKRKTIDDDA